MMPLLTFNHLMEVRGSAAPTVGCMGGCSRRVSPHLPACCPPDPRHHPCLQLWRETCPTVTVEALHNHVVALHRVFLAGLDAAGHPALNSRTLVALQVGSMDGVF